MCISCSRILKNLVIFEVNFCMSNTGLFRSHLKGFFSENDASMLHIMIKMQTLKNTLNVIKSITERKFNNFPCKLFLFLTK